jgi:diacylglycerol kinase (ATP)
LQAVKSKLLLNPAAGRGRGGRALAALERLCARHGVELEASDSPSDLALRARRAAESGVDRLLVAGGDGTWHWAAQGLAGTSTALAPIPLGTGNDLARELGYPLRAESAFAAALAGERDRIDLGRIGERYFCGVAGIGFDATVAEYARTRVRRLRGPLVYAWATLASLASFRPPRATLEVGGRRIDGEVFLVAFANGSHYGGGMRIAPAADPRDGLLDVVVIHRRSKLHLLRVFPKVYSGRHVTDPSVEQLRTGTARLAITPPQSINADGEGLGRTGDDATDVSIAPGALKVVRAAPRPDALRRA